MKQIFVGRTSEIKDGDRRIVNAGGLEIGVFYQGGEFYAYSNHCPHSGGPACEGILIPKVVDIIAEDRTYQGQTFSYDEMHFVCPWHGYEFDLKSGRCAGDPRLTLRKFEVVHRGDEVFVIA